MDLVKVYRISKANALLQFQFLKVYQLQHDRQVRFLADDVGHEGGSKRRQKNSKKCSPKARPPARLTCDYACGPELNAVITE